MNLTRFLSDEDQALRELSDEEFNRLSAAALRALQSTNDQDHHWYRHGCIAVTPGAEEELPRMRVSPL